MNVEDDMSLPAFIGFAAVMSFIAIHTISYAVWNWRNGNRAGSAAVFLLCATSVALPVYIAFFRT